MAEKKPYSRGEFNRALVLNALADPFNVAILALMLIAGIVLGIAVPMIPAAAAVYGLAAARTYLDEDVANKVLGEQRAQRKAIEPATPRADPNDFVPAIGELVEQSRLREHRIRDAIERAALPYDEVIEEVDRFVVAIDQTAGRAQLLAEALHDTPPDAVEARLKRERDAGAADELVDALTTQLATLRKMEQQLERFLRAMERILIELDTVRSQLVSVSASTETAEQERVAAEVRALREHMGTIADGMAAAYEQPS